MFHVAMQGYKKERRWPRWPLTGTGTAALIVVLSLLTIVALSLAR